ncbi:unnamed protein product [Effrenium voratum]|uniref:Uncharacterized protein n=1 Tax=Effrenium voratum TaxID=2562239 RepID=A0AA36N697_9DINO|nr:unnamed protein product [Effrenium voratum]
MVSASVIRCGKVSPEVQAFPFAMQEHCRAKESTNLKQRLHWLLEEMHQARVELSGQSSRAGPVARHTAPPSNRPLHIISRLLYVINSIPTTEDSFTSKERVWLLSMATSLSHTVGRCERLIQTPVPLSYARHTARFVSIWTLTLPFALVASCRWLTVPFVAFVTWALFGILEIGNLIEDPFRRSIELTPICEAIYHDAGRALGDVPSSSAVAMGVCAARGSQLPGDRLPGDSDLCEGRRRTPYSETFECVQAWQEPCPEPHGASRLREVQEVYDVAP